MRETDSPTIPNQACEHPRVTHYHGTRACYTLDGCRCRDCQAARKRYDRRRSKWIGEFPTLPPARVDAEPIRAHLHDLMEQGMGAKRIAHVSGVPHGAVSKLLYGDYVRGSQPSKKISRRNAEKLLALELDLADGAPVPKDEAVAIVDELVARGWSKSAIAQRIVGPSARSLQIGRGPTVQAGTIRALRPLLHERVPPRTHAPTGKKYHVNVDHEWQHVAPSTPGVPIDWKPGSAEWLRVMRAGLKSAVEDSIRRHGRIVPMATREMV